MNSLFDLIQRLLALKGPAVLATLVRVEGSAYRRQGARLILDAEGIQAGVISGGCLETDLAERAKKVLETGQPEMATYSLGSDLDRVWGTGMGCEGHAEILLQRIEARPPLPWAAWTDQQVRKRRSLVLATVYAVKGEVPAQVGDTFAYAFDGHGLLPIDPDLSVLLHRATQAALAEGRAQVQHIEMPGGSLEVALEPIQPPFALWIFGANENARPLAAMAQLLGWRVGILDHRPGLLSVERFPGAELHPGLPATVIPGLPMDGRGAAVILSHVFDRDREALMAFLAAPLPYVGLQGSRGRTTKLLAELEGEGFDLDEARAARLFAPMGLDLGCDTPEEIALAVLAEAKAVLCGREAKPLRNGWGNIH